MRWEEYAAISATLQIGTQVINRYREKKLIEWIEHFFINKCINSKNALIILH